MVLPGRDIQLDALRQSYRRCAAGNGGVVIVRGAVGSGRTRLLDAFGQEATAAGATVLTATGSAMERDFPLAVLHQLLQGAAFDADTGTRVARLLEEGALAATAYSSRLTAPVVQGLCGALLRVAAHGSGPVVIAVDDAHDIDPQSLECLLFLARRTASARVLIVLTERETTASPHPAAVAELSRQPHCTSIPLPLLSPAAVTELLTDRVGPTLARRIAPDWHAVSGGNALLLNALLEDHAAAAAAWSGCSVSGLTIGDAFRRGLVTCLYRLEPDILAAAGALALLGEPAPRELLAEILGVEPDAAERSVLLLQRAGLLDRGWFRHPEARAEVIRSMPCWTASASPTRPDAPANTPTNCPEDSANER